MNFRKISPRFDTSKLQNATLEDYIDVYEDQVNGWYLSYAKAMHGDEHAGFAALQLAFSYFEGHAISFSGKDSFGKSREFFANGLRAVFPELDSQLKGKLLENTINALYDDGRCGFFHTALTRRRFILRDGSPIIRIEADPANNDEVSEVYIDRRKFVDRVCSHFQNYIARLRNPMEIDLRGRFIEALRLRHGTQIKVSP